MIKELLGQLDYSAWAEVSLLTFAAVFIGVAIKTVLGDRREAERNATLALAADPELDSHE